MKAVMTIAPLAYVLTLTAVAIAAVDPVVGTTAIVGKGGDGAVCAETRDKVKAAYRANSIHDGEGIAQALRGGTQLVRGQRVLVIDNAVGSGVMTGIDVRVRILSGPDARIACWAWQTTMHLQPAR